MLRIVTYKSWNALAVIIFIVSSVLATRLYSESPSYQGDESGTLVLVAVTANSAVLSVDSKVTGDGKLESQLDNPDPGLPLPEDSTGKRKLVDIGKRSACAVQGWLGSNYENLDVANSLRRYAEGHPEVEAEEAIDDLLIAASAVWNRRAFSNSMNLPKGRHNGDTVSSIWCVTFSAEPKIIHGETYVTANTRASWKEDPLPKSPVYMDGVLDTIDFRRFLQNPKSSYLVFDPRVLEVNALNQAVAAELSSNLQTANALAAWKASIISPVPTLLSEKQIHDLSSRFSSLLKDITRKLGLLIMSG